MDIDVIKKYNVRVFEYISCSRRREKILALTSKYDDRYFNIPKPAIAISKFDLNCPFLL